MRREIAFLLLIPLVFLAGCTTANNNQQQQVSSFKCVLPSQPGMLTISVQDFPSEIIASTNSPTQITFTALVQNTITHSVQGDKIKYHWEFIPNVGKIQEGDREIPIAYYEQNTNQITPMVDTFAISTEIPQGISEIGVYKGVLKWSFEGYTKMYFPICLGYNPKITEVSPELLVCNPEDLPQPCYTASPVIPQVLSVSAVGLPGRDKAVGYYRITFSLVDSYGGIGDCSETSFKKVTIKDIVLKIDNDEIKLSDGSNILRCSISKDKNGKYYIYLDKNNQITCYIDYQKLQERCASSSKCTLSVDQLKVGKSAILSVEIEYPYCKTISLGPAKITILE